MVVEHSNPEEREADALRKLFGHRNGINIAIYSTDIKYHTITFRLTSGLTPEETQYLELWLVVVLCVVGLSLIALLVDTPILMSVTVLIVRCPSL